MTPPETPALECGPDLSVSPCATLAEQSLVATQGHSEQEVNLSGIALRCLRQEPDPPRPVPVKHGLCHPDGYQAMSLGSLSGVHFVLHCLGVRQH